MSVRVSVVILSWNTLQLTRACLRSISQNPPRDPFEVVLVDNASEDGSADMVRRDFPSVRLIANEKNELYAEGNNRGAREASGDWLVLLNSDTEVQPGALDQLVDWLERHPEYGAAAPQLLNPDGSIQTGCSRIPTLLDPAIDSTLLGRFRPGRWWSKRTRMADFDHAHEEDVDQPPAACFVMRREEFLAMGGFDPVLSLFFNDVDLCKRLWEAGRKIRFLPSAKVVHHLGASTKSFHDRNGNALWFRNRLSYYEKHHGYLGAALLRSVLLAWGVEVGAGIVFGRKTVAQKQEALKDLGTHLKRSIA
jgi:hypothetical protein